jgi:diguanylate cyclase (GGDEF)-like protein
LGTTLNLRRIRNKAFSQALTLMYSRLTVVNAGFILLALGLQGTVSDYLIAGAYFIWGLTLLFLVVQVFAIRVLRTALQLIDLGVTVYMISRTGGLTSPLYLFLFSPVLVAMVRNRWAGIITWSSAMALLFAAAVYLSGTFELTPFLVRAGYFYLFGIIGGFIIDRTYLVTEEVSNQFARHHVELKWLTADLNQVSGSSDLDQILEQTLRIIRQHNFAPKLAAMVFDDRGDLLLVKAEGWSDEAIKRYNYYPLSKYSLLMAPTLVFRKPLICPDIRKYPELARPFGNSEVKSLFIFPLIVQDEIAGVVGLADDTLKSISEEDRDILTGIVNQAGITIQNVINLIEEKKRADTDGLTALYNRRYFSEQLEKLSQTHRQQGQSLSLILMDIDDFKKYNDSFGHPAGDRLLKKVARVVLDTARSQDIAARYGGEEFAVILPRCGRSVALEIAERIRVAIGAIGDYQGSITISVGVGTLPDQADDALTLIEFADRSMYFAKKTGKNRVCSGFEAEA